ncbi:MAG: hypothetical protein JXR77_18080 [Lentisphaeria bacterium]|nr:hypothetical protein [Lentisphaeria bacterium]
MQRQKARFFPGSLKPYRPFARGRFPRLLPRLWVVFGAVCAVLVTRAPGQAIPDCINYQGFLSNEDGTPLATGNYTMTFRIYDGETGGAIIWGPLILDGQPGDGHGPTVYVVDGQFNVALGPEDVGSRLLGSTFTAGSQRWLEIQVEGSAAMARQQILTTPYAFAVGPQENLTVTGTLTAGKVSLPDGTPGSPLFAFADDGDTGLYRAGENVLGFTVGGVERARIDADGTLVTSARVCVPDGTAAAPTVTFSSDTNTGLYRVGTDSMGFATNGQKRLGIDGAGTVAVASTLALADGSAAAPSLAFTADANTGLCRVGADSLGLVTGGQQRLGIDAVGKVSVASSLVLADGSAASPIVTFASDPNTGIYRIGADQLSFAAGGRETLRVTDWGPYVEVDQANYTAEFRNNRTAYNAADPSYNANGVRIRLGSASAGNTFISFCRGDGVQIGSITGWGGLGIAITGRQSGDYAEWLPRRDPAAVLEDGDVVGVLAGGIGRDTAEAERVMVVSSCPIIIGTCPADAAERALGNVVAFVGQTPVRVRGPVTEGDYIAASGLDDGTAVAIPAGDLSPADLRLVVGRAWESSDDPGIKPIRTVVGLDVTAGLIASLGARVTALEADNAELRAAMKALQAQMRTVMEDLRR